MSDRSHIRLEVLSSAELFERAAQAVAAAMRTAIDARGTCSLALSGGDTPAPMFRSLARADIEWAKVDVFQVDERVAPAGHPDRNLTMIEEQLCAGIAGDQPRLHPMNVTTHQLDVSADAYAIDLEHVCGRPPVIDVLHLGLGPDGHTASLVPDDPVLDVRDRWVAVTRPYRGYVRMTMTYPVLDNAGLLVFVVTGEDRSRAVQLMLAGHRSVPSGRIDPRDVVVFADAAAASASR